MLHFTADEAKINEDLKKGTKSIQYLITPLSEFKVDSAEFKTKLVNYICNKEPKDLTSMKTLIYQGNSTFLLTRELYTEKELREIRANMIDQLIRWKQLLSDEFKSPTISRSQNSNYNFLFSRVIGDIFIQTDRRDGGINVPQDLIKPRDEKDTIKINDFIDFINDEIKRIRSIKLNSYDNFINYKEDLLLRFQENKLEIHFN